MREHGLYSIPNLFTFSRILTLPFMVLCYYLHFPGNRIVAAVLFISAAATDWLDGYLARRLSQETPFGAFLDPVADKIIVATALVLIVEQQAHIVVSLAAAIIIGREITISALREWMAAIGKRASVAVTWVGKVKTTLQMLSIAVLLAYKPGKWEFLNISGRVLLCVAAALTLWSMLVYFKIAWPDLTLSAKQE